MDETWLDKPTPGEGLGPIGAPRNLKVKSYSFWEPLDEQYVSAMARYARSHGFTYVAFFDGARAFFGYLTGPRRLKRPATRVSRRCTTPCRPRTCATLTVSGTGLALHKALAPGETAARAVPMD